MTMTREVEGVGQRPFGNPSPSAQISSLKKSVTEPWGDMIRKLSNSLGKKEDIKHWLKFIMSPGILMFNSLTWLSFAEMLNTKPFNLLQIKSEKNSIYIPETEDPNGYIQGEYILEWDLSRYLQNILPLRWVFK